MLLLLQMLHNNCATGGAVSSPPSPLRLRPLPFFTLLQLFFLLSHYYSAAFFLRRASSLSSSLPSLWLCSLRSHPSACHSNVGLAFERQSNLPIDQINKSAAAPRIWIINQKFHLEFQLLFSFFHAVGWLCCYAWWLHQNTFDILCFTFFSRKKIMCILLSSKECTFFSALLARTSFQHAWAFILV